MTTRTLLNLLLLAGLLVLGLLIHFESGRDADADARFLAPLDAAAIDTIRLQATGRPPLTLERQGDTWRHAEPPHWRADAFAVRTLLRLAQERAQRSYAGAELDLDKLGLAPPRARLWFNQVEIAFGATDPLDELRYVQLGERVYLIQDLYQPLVAGNSNQWISRRLLAEGASIRGLVLPAFTLQRAVDGHWHVTPEQAQLGSDALQGLVERWRQATALSVTPATPDTAPASLRVELADRTLPFAARPDGDQWILHHPDLGLDYHLSAHTAAELMLTPDQSATTEAAP